MDYTSAFSYESISKYKTSKYKSSVRSSNDYSMLSNYDDTNESVKRNDILTILTYVITVLGYLLVFLTAPVSFLVAVKSISENQKAIQFRLGRFWSLKGPGLTLVIPFIDKITFVDMRVKAFHVPPMLVMLQDGGSISLGANIMYSIQDAVVATLSLQDINHTIRTLGQSVMYQVVSKYSMEKLRRNKSDPNAFIKKELQQEIMEWGLSIHKVELSHITELSAPPTAMQQVQEQLGPIFGKMGGLEGIISTAADYYFKPNVDETNDVDNVFKIMDKFKTKIFEAIDDSLIDKIGKKFLFHLVLHGSLDSYSNEMARLLLLNCKDKPVGLTEYFVSDLKQEERESCDVELKISVFDLIKFLKGEISKTALYFQGRVEVSGDISALELLSELKTLINIEEFL